MPPLIRKIIFSTFVALFILSGAIIISYSLGWKLDFDPPAGGFILEKTGGINIKTSPKNVAIKINGKDYRNQSGILQNGTLISGLLPKTYKIDIEKFGYFSYSKNIRVKPALVMKLLSIVLLPEKIAANTVMQVKESSIIDSANNGNKFITNGGENGFYYLQDLNNSSSTFNLSHAFSNAGGVSKIKKIYFVPFKNSNFVVEDASGLKILNTETGTAELIIKNSTKDPIIAWTIRNPNIYFIKTSDSNGKTSAIKTFSLYSYNLIIKNTFLLSQLPETIFAQTITEMKSFPSNNKIAFLEKIGNLYVFDQGSGKIEKIGANVRLFSFSPDDKKLAFIDNDGVLNIYYLEDYNLDEIKKIGDTDKFKLDNRENISDIQWYEDSAHLLVNFKSSEENEVKFIETDSRPDLNIQPVISDTGDFYYNPEINSLYFIKNNFLEKIDFNSL